GQQDQKSDRFDALAGNPEAFVLEQNEETEHEHGPKQRRYQRITRTAPDQYMQHDQQRPTDNQYVVQYIKPVPARKQQSAGNSNHRENDAYPRPTSYGLLPAVSKEFQREQRKRNVDHIGDAQHEWTILCSRRVESVANQFVLCKQTNRIEDGKQACPKQ